MKPEKAVYLPAPSVAHRIIGGHAVLVNLADNRMLRLNETGSRIWAMLDGRGLAEIAAAVCEEFEVSEEDSVRDTRAFLETLDARGLVVRPG